MKKTTIQKYRPLYLLTIGIVFLLRYFSKVTDSDVINWMLAPTVRWAGILSGISFEYLPHQGYASHSYCFLVAPSCSGIRFMTISFLMLTSSLYRIEKKAAGYLWFGFSAVFSYITTILVNSLRIIAAIHLPLLLKRAGLMNGWLTPDRLHTLIGTTVYFSSLCVLYLLASAVCGRWFLYDDKENAQKSDAFSASVPVFWYLLIVLILPFGKRLLTNNWNGFGQYALLILCSCFPITAILRLRRAPAGRTGKTAVKP
ncbi:MAG: exosortase K [Blautia sp.]|nr:exosortase K [Blautia sp.]MCM1201346.1 exosortase K [Bacteroides fragilis]